MGFDASLAASDVVEDAIRQFLSGARENMNRLSSNVGANATTLEFDFDINDIAEASYIEIDTEVYRVWGVDRTTNSVTVQPAMIGSTSSTHTAGALAYINPRVFRHAAMRALNDELAALSSPANGLYAVGTYEFQSEATVYDYPLPSFTIIDGLRVEIKAIDSIEHWHKLLLWDVRPASDTTDFTSGYSLFIPDPMPNRTVQFVYSYEFSPLSALTDDIENVSGLPATAQDILPLGIILRLGSIREIKRNFTESQGDTRLATEVPPQAVQNSFSAVRALRQQRIDEEAARLIRQWGPGTQ